jgi:hypothetical protein
MFVISKRLSIVKISFIDSLFINQSTKNIQPCHASLPAFIQSVFQCPAPSSIAARF